MEEVTSGTGGMGSNETLTSSSSYTGKGLVGLLYLVYDVTYEDNLFFCYLLNRKAEVYFPPSLSFWQISIKTSFSSKNFYGYSNMCGSMSFEGKETMMKWAVLH